MFKGDHKYPVSNLESPVVIMYAEIGSEEFSRFHKQLVTKVSAGEITYILRHYVAVSIDLLEKRSCDLSSITEE